MAVIYSILLRKSVLPVISVYGSVYTESKNGTRFESWCEHQHMKMHSNDDFQIEQNIYL